MCSIQSLFARLELTPGPAESPPFIERPSDGWRARRVHFAGVVVPGSSACFVGWADHYSQGSENNTSY